MAPLATALKPLASDWAPPASNLLLLASDLERLASHLARLTTDAQPPTHDLARRGRERPNVLRHRGQGWAVLSPGFVPQVNKVLKTAIKSLGLSLREVERRQGLSRGYLTRLFGGEMDLKVDHVVDIAEVLGIEPEEIFRLAFHAAQGEPSPATLHLRQVMGVTVEEVEERPAPAPPPSAAFDIERAIEQMVNRALSKAFGKLGLLESAG